MKSCSQCSSVFPDDFLFGLTDGTVLQDSGGEQETVLNRKFWNPSPGAVSTAEAAAIRCASCGLENHAGSKFCKKCGAPFFTARYFRQPPMLPPVAQIPPRGP
jgi:hypothetical protein